MAHFGFALPRHENSQQIRSALALALLTLIALMGVAPLSAQEPDVNCDRFGCGRLSCATPARPAPPALWGDLQPADTFPLPGNRDATDFNEFRQAYGSKAWYYSMDVENGYVFAGTAYGLQAWDARTTPANPTLLGTLTYGQIPVGINSAEEKWPMRAADAPEGVDNTVAFVGVAGMGLSVVDFSNKGQPRVVYQSHKKNSESVYAATIGGRQYAFMAASGSDAGGGLYIFDMTAAKTAGVGGACTESAPAPADPGDASCPGVLQGKFKSKVNPNKSDVFQVHGVDNFIILSFGTSRGFEIWDVSNPASPVLKIDGQSDRSVYGVAMWRDGSRYYAATRTEYYNGVSVAHETNTFDVNCIASSCSGLSAPLSHEEHDAGTSNAYLTFSRSNGTPFLYLGSDNRCTGSVQREWLLDVSSPGAPRDITGAKVTASDTFLSGVKQTITYGYWGSYYRGNPGGLNLMMPRSAKFSGDYLYRAGLSIFDIHKRTTASPPVSDFTYSPIDVYPNTPVTFTDRSSGAPFAWSWTFLPDGSPPSSLTANPVVSFPTTGAKTVTLIATNAVSSGSLAQKTINVLSATPAIGTAIFSPPSPIVCQTITFSATGVTGQPTLGYGWVVKKDLDSSTVASGSGTTIAWNTAGAAAGSYTATLTISNTSGSTSKSVSANLGGLSALGFSGAGGAPTNDAFTNGTVKFHAMGLGTTEWSWDFGDGNGFQPFTSDPINGPDPTFTYTSTGNKAVRVKIRNCNQTTPLQSADLVVNILQTTPLVAGFQATGGVFCSGVGCVATTNQPITFTDQSTGAQLWDYDWDGDGTYEQADNASPVTTHTYTAAGIYNPKQRVRRGAAEQATFTHNAIIVSTVTQQPPAISVFGPTSGNVNSNYTFTASASNCTPTATWSWSVAGGTVQGGSTGSSISIAWASNGSKTVTASNSGCSGASGSRSITISDGNGGGGGGGLQASFSFTPAAPKIGDPVSFDGTASTGSPASYTWSFGDGAEAGNATATHAYTKAGNFLVRLSIFKPGTGNGCLLGTCVSEATKTVTVVDGTPPLSGDFTPSVECTNQFGISSCNGATGQDITFTAAAVDGNSYSWSFGDGATGTGRTVTHAWAAPNTYAVSLLVTRGTQTGTSSRTLVISGNPKPREKTVVLPWIAQTRGALVQSSDLWVFNPSASTIQVQIEFRKRGTPESNPPRVTRTVPPGGVLYSADAIHDLFGAENIAGFITVHGMDTDVEPVITSFNTTFQTDGKQFGQSIPGLSMDSGTGGAAASAKDASTLQHLIGLNDTGDRLAYFGVTNPSSVNAVYHLRIYDRTGHLLGESAADFTLSQFGQRQYQVGEIRDLFGVSSDDDYRVEVETKQGGPVFPYAANLRLVSGDPSFIEARRASVAKGYLVGIFSTPGLGGSKWQSDLVLSNAGSQVVTSDLTFQGSGLQTAPTAPVHVTLQPGESQRLANVLFDKWNLTEAVGTLIFQSAADNGVFPVAQAEVYDNASPTKRFGQTMSVQTDADAAVAGKSQFLVGLRQEAGFRSTVTLFNPSANNATVDLIYRGVDGTVLGTLSNRVIGAGKVQQINGGQHPLAAGGVTGGFTVEVKVKAGSILSTGQVVNNQTNDPSFISGRTR
jgi:PKD repeat protein